RGVEQHEPAHAVEVAQRPGEADHPAPIVGHERDVAQIQVLDQSLDVVHAARERGGVGLVTRLVGEAAAHVVGRHHAMLGGEALDEAAEAEGPGGISVEHEEGLAAPLVQVVHADAAAHVEVPTLPRVEVADGMEVDGAHHESPSMIEERPLPMPSRATRSPSERKACSSAMARLMGRATVPVFPKFGKVEKSFSSGRPSALRMLRRLPAPTWWQMTRSTSSGCQPISARKRSKVRTPKWTPWT